jgi:DNA-binding transcriptional MerR regulator
MNDSELSELVKASAAAQKLCVHVRTLAAWSDRGIAPQPLRLGPRGLRFYRAADIEQMARSGAEK